jgi:hypothetical protein
MSCEIHVHGGERFGVDGVFLSCVLPPDYPLGRGAHADCWPRCALRGETAWVEGAVEASVLECLRGLRGPPPPPPPPLSESATAAGAAGASGDGAELHPSHSHPDGQPVLFEWVEWLREQLEVPPDVADGSRWESAESRLESRLAADRAAMAERGRAREAESIADAATAAEAAAAAAAARASSARQRPYGMSAAHAAQGAAAPDMYALCRAAGTGLVHGEPITDRKSTFQAHLCRVSSREQVRAVLAALNTDRKIARATHNMVAYRILAEGSGAGGLAVQINDNDDDGESQAGSNMAHVMEMMGVNNVIVVVSRWYGGIQLGPDRFKHINNCTRDVLEQNGFERSNKGKLHKGKS